MTGTIYQNFTGKGMWVKIHPDKPDEFRGSESWNLGLVMNSKEADNFRKSGLQGDLTPYDGGFLAKFRCITGRTFKNKETGKKEYKAFDAPKVTTWDDDKGKYVPWEPVNPDHESLGIGNGSGLRVNVMIYDVKTDEGMVKGHRLAGVTVFENSLVPFLPRDNSKDAGEASSDGEADNGCDGGPVNPEPAEPVDSVTKHAGKTNTSNETDQPW